MPKRMINFKDLRVKDYIKFVDTRTGTTYEGRVDEFNTHGKGVGRTVTGWFYRDGKDELIEHIPWELYWPDKELPRQN